MPRQPAGSSSLVMEQAFNVEALVDIDGPGSLQAQRILTGTHLFVVRIGDPIVLLVKGFEALSELRSEYPIKNG